MGINHTALRRTLLELAALPPFWEQLARGSRPVVLYGMGDGADKALDQCDRHHIPVEAVFASHGFARGQPYRNFAVRTLEQVEAVFYPQGLVGSPRFTTLLCFATERLQVLGQIDRVAGRHPLLAPDFPVYGETAFTPDLVATHREQLECLYRLLADDLSRRVLVDVMEAKLTGNPRLLRRCETPRQEMLQRIPLDDGAVFVDAGAYTGDTVEKFVRELRRRGCCLGGALAMEPDRRNFSRLQKQACILMDGGCGPIHCVQAGAWSGPGQMAFDHRSGRRAALEAGAGSAVVVDSIDRLLDGGRASCIKYDVEGAEREALLGTAHTIRRWRPALAVAAYHRSEDLFSLPLLIHQLCPEYRLYLRHHPYLPAWETICYAIADQ